MTYHFFNGFMAKVTAVIVTAMILATPSHAQHRDIDVVSPEQQALNKYEVPPSDLRVKAWVDHGNGTYRTGETLRLCIKTNKKAYITVIDQGTSGKIHVIFPNRFQEKNRVLAHRVVQIPTDDAPFRFRVSGPAGIELIKVIATSHPISAVSAKRLVQRGAFYSYRGTGEELVKDLRIELNKTDGRPPEAAAVGLRVKILQGAAMQMPNGNTQTSTVPEVLFQRGEAAFYGDRGKRDYGQALKWYLQAAKSGHNRAMFRIGWIHLHGLGVAKNPKTARIWYKKAAALGNTSAMVELARMHWKGIGVARDYAVARKWLERATIAGNGKAMMHLAVIYDQGLGVRADPAKAAKLALEAIKRGQWRVQDRLAEFTQATRREIQKLLRRAGLYNGSVDGVVGPETHAALVNYGRAK
jgi:hypothetical protein